MKLQKYHLNKVGAADILLSDEAYAKFLNPADVLIAIKILDYLLFKHSFNSTVNSSNLKKYYKNILDPSQIDAVLHLMTTLELVGRDEYEDLVLSGDVVQHVIDLYLANRDTRGGKRELKVVKKKEKKEVKPTPTAMDNVFAKYGLGK